MKIAVLAVQGAFAEHCKMFRQLDVPCIELRQPDDLKQSYDGVVLPGGESTVQGKLLRELDLYETLRCQIAEGLPVLATCAGLILLAARLSNDPQVHFGTLPVTVRRNAYGRQLGSFSAVENITCLNAAGQETFNIRQYPMRFIRAPYIEDAAPSVQVMARIRQEIVMVRYQNQLAMSFHPELTQDSRIHELFIKMAAEASYQ